MNQAIKLNNGVSIPRIGLGLWQITNEKDFITAFQSALTAGYQLFDTAQFYRNEQYLARAIHQTKVDRSKIFITSKIAVNNFGYKKTHKSFEDSLEKLNIDYIDLMLLHFPVSILRKKSWLALEEIYQTKKARAIGVSNYTIRHLKELKNYANITPVINQVELHVFLQQPELRDYCQNNSIQIEAYSPLAHGEVMNNPLIIELAKKYKKSYAQIMLRFLLQLELVIIPKSITPLRIVENIDIFNFEIDNADMTKLMNLDKNLRTCWNPTLVP